MDKESKERPAFTKRQAGGTFVTYAQTNFDSLGASQVSAVACDPSAPSIASSSHGSPTIACPSGCCTRCLALHLGRGLLLGSF